MRNRILSLLFLLPFISESVSAALVEEIYGTAHNSVVRKPGTDEWYIVYHRINKNYLDKDKGPGVHREVCIDRMEFNADGTIQRVKVSK